MWKYEKIEKIIREKNFLAKKDKKRLDKRKKIIYADFANLAITWHDMTWRNIT